MSAEFAVALPAVIVVLAVGMGALQVGAMQVRVADAAADAARLLGRGEADAASARVAALGPGAAPEVVHTGHLVCVTVRAEPALAFLSGTLELSASGCALDDTAPAPGETGR
ncbi:TadE family type IV pilus minor pilin [Herbiconiux sp. KACC 21604]|uniref:TadE family type IV pilus minor pilin n=1 Tax=unclassified Herbiconiux TaxID=2618217 RepID=UPI0020A2B625|nr:TadE family type IV pilus minor pilin [Herbiconiux sp. SALV-R1]WPO85604.1 TadE family type IV pilus minor pilin [Herbiconiux sp. KACC 21604]